MCQRYAHIHGRDARDHLRHFAVLFLALLPAAGAANTVTINPTANAVSGTVTTPTNAYTDNAAYANLATSPTTSTESVSGFANTNLGTISDVTVYVNYKTSAAPSNDTYKFEAAVDGTNFTSTIVAATSNNQAADVTAGLSLGALSWTQVGTLAVRGTATQVGKADAFTLDWDAAWIVVTYAPVVTLTIGDAPAVGNTTITQTQTTALDGFTLTPGSGTANVTSVTVAFTAGNAAVSSVSINSASNCGGTSYGSVSSPGASAGIPTNFNVSAATTYYVCVTGGPVASNTSVTGNVSSVTAAGYSSSDTDSTNATVTVRPAVIAIGEGPGVGDSSIPANQTAALDAFTLTPEAGTAGVSAVTVGFTAGNGAVSSVSIDSASSCGGTSYGSLSSPGASATIPTTLTLSAATTYYVCVTGAAVAVNTAVTGSVSSVTAANYSWTDGDTTGATVTVLSSVPEGDSTANSTRPVVSIVNPVSGPVGATFKVQARVYSPAGDVTSVVLHYDASTQAMTPSSHYGTTTTSGVWEHNLSGLTAGTYVLRVQAFNASGDVYSRKVTVIVPSSGRGDGNLLVRDNASQLCSDCHGIKTHSSETTSNKYGSWSLTCRDCHTPHSTHNLGLVREQITPPSLTQEEAPRAVVFRNRAGYTTGGMANPENNGVCQVCHTRTQNYRQDGTLVTHETGKNCSSCHKHATGLQVVCTGCHGNAGRASVAGADAKQTAAPPVDASGAGATVYVANGGAHVAHVNQATYRSAPLACDNCHTMPNTHQTPSQTDVVWTGLASSGGVTPTPAAGALTGAWTSAPSCTNYCHGASLTGGTTPSWTGGFSVTCAQCHGSPPPVTTAINANHPQNPACDACHGLFGNAGYDFAGKTLSAAAKGTHVDGTLQRPTKGCASCHGDIAVADGTVVDRLDGRAAPGFDAGAVDTRGNTNLDRATAVGVGAHAKHILGGGLMAAKGCTVCHALPANGNEDHADAAPAWAWSTPATSESVTPTYAQPTCTNYCHSNAKPLGQASATTVSVPWTSTTALGCSSCHKTVAGGATDLSAKHGRHLTYAYTCDECHAPTMQNDSSSSIGTVANHVDGTKEVDFSTTLWATTIDQSGGAYSGTPGYTCSSTYCHSSGTANAAPFGAPVGVALSWNTGTTAAACDNCHGGNAAATYKLATGSHAAHMNNATYLGANVVCASCHDATIGADDRTLDGLTGLLSHVNGQRDVSAASWNDLAKSCASNYCHSNGTEALVAADYKSVTWGNTLANDCLACHGSFSPAAFTAVYGEPNYANDTGSPKTRNSHAKHVSPVLATAKTQCVSCHAGTVDATGALLASGGLHVNSARNVSGAAIGAYDEATETCSSISCHGGGNATWGATLGCGDCHGTAGRVKTIAGTVDANLVGSPPKDAAGLSSGLRVGAHMKHVDSDTYRSNGLLCADCHPATISHNGTRDAAWSALASADGATMSPAAGNGAYSAAWETTPTCTNYCHGNTLNGGTNKTPSWGSTGMTCSSCHGAAPPVSATVGETHPQNTACASCHGTGYSTAGLSGTAKTYHVNGSIVGGTDKPNSGCTACHGVLAGVSGAAVLNTSMTSAPGYNGTGVDTTGATAYTVVKVGAHDAHVRDEGAANLVAPLDCSNCHGTKPADGTTTHANATIALGWSTIATGGGIVASPSPAAFNASWESTPNCTNYCHSNARPLGQASATTVSVTWNTAPTLTCTSCHSGAGTAGGTNLSVAHQKHTDTFANGGYALTCNRCHVTSATSNSAVVPGGGQHVDGTRDVDFDTTGPNNSGGTYAYAAAPAYTCSNIYCHSNGADRVAGYVSGPSAAWNAAAPLACTSCHGFGTTMVNQGHGAHTNQAATYGTTFGCQTCHSATTAAGTTITDTSLHVNFVANVDAGLSYAASSCTTYCHSAGAKLTGGTPPAYFPKDWTTPLAGCSNCHGAYTGVTNASKAGEPNYDNLGVSSLQANSHFAHVGGATSCVNCHVNTVDAAGATILNTGKHLNGMADIVFSAAYSTITYTPRSGTTAPSCVNVSCHDNPAITAQWGGTIVEGPCYTCHLQAGAGNGDVDDYVFQNAIRAYVDDEDWNAYGHGRSTAFSLTGQSGNAAPNFAAATEQGCLYCHTPKVQLFAAGEFVSHGQPTNPFRLANSTWGGTKNGTCLVCHSAAAAGFDPDGATPTYASKIASAGARVSATHYGADHVAAGKGGEFCWDCHDPHGDFNYAPSNRLIAFMIQERPTRTHTLSDPNDWGIPQLTPVSELTANTVDFSAAVSGTTTVFEGTDYTETGASAPYNGVCQVCHTATAYHLDSGAGRTHMTGAQCTKCHSHSQAVATDAFKQATACDGCHSASPTASGKHTLHVGAATPAYGSVTPAATAGAYAYNCGKCHSTVSTNHYNFNTGGTTTTPYQVEVAFDWASGATPYTLGTASNDTSAVGLVFRTTTGTCTTYCHSNAAPAGGTNAWASPTWDTAAAATICTSCHNMLATTTVPDTNLSHGHYLHTTNAAGGYFYNCSDCHNGIATGKADYPTTAGTIADKSKHVDGTPSVAFNGTFNPGTPTYNAAPARSCSNTYCHSNGTSAASPPANTSIAWTATRAADCTSCHGGNATAGTVIGTNEHAEHINKLAYLGTNLACGRCHSTTVATTNDRAIATLANHVNRTADVSMPDGGTWGGAATKTCSSVYCHSDGTETPTYKAGLDWDAGQTLTDDCKACHGSDASPAFTSAYGEPNYVSSTASDDTRNSHQKHVSTVLATAKTQCVDCHSATIDAAGSLVAGGNHLANGVDVTVGGKIGSYNPTGEACGTITCHGGGSAVWGDPASATCVSCHVGTGDVNNWNIADGTSSRLDSTQWTSFGHGSTSTAGNSFAEFGAIASNDRCSYCHDTQNGSAIHGQAGNPFRLRGAANSAGATALYSSATAVDVIAVCLNCHSPSGTVAYGVDPDGAGALAKVGPATARIDSYHYGATDHTATQNGGQRCWDCHDPHGDATNVKMIGSDTLRAATDAHGLAGTRSTNAAVFTATGAGNYATAGRTGVCQVCHTTTSYWRWDSEPTAHKTTAENCISCHAHQQPAQNEAFKGKGGGSDCYGCHFDGEGTRRVISGDFTLQSHHVRGTMSSTFPSTAGTGNNADCVVCHSEGQIITAYSADCSTGTLPMTCSNPSYHANGVIDLRDVDTAAPAKDGTGANFVYDKGDVASSAGAAANWNSSNQKWREWTSGVDETGGATLPANAGLDKFCLNCHDSGGAAQIATFKISTETSRTATDPFWDGATNITNTYDLLSRPAVIDIKSKQSGNPPAQGTFSRHAIRGQSTSKYTKYTAIGTGFTSMYEAARFTSMGTDEGGKPNWNDTSVMGCADCHTTDGANTTVGNAHGSTSEYLLKDASGGAAEGMFKTLTNICVRCHQGSIYGKTHTGGSGSDFVDSADLTGSARTGSNAPIWGMACLNCHGGAQGNGSGAGDTNPFGWIHGSSQVFGTGAGGTGGTRNAFRFMNGAGLRYYTPGGANWDTASGTCVTLGTGDSLSGCTQHTSGKATGTLLKRPLAY